MQIWRDWETISYEDPSHDLRHHEVRYTWYNEEVRLEYVYLFNMNVAGFEDGYSGGKFLFTDMNGQYDLFLKEVERSNKEFSGEDYMQESLDLL